LSLLTINATTFLLSIRSFAAACALAGSPASSASSIFTG